MEENTLPTETPEIVGNEETSLAPDHVETVAQVEQTAKEFHDEENDNSKNIRALREKAARADQAERERDEAVRVLQQIKQVQSPDPQPEEDYNLEISPDDLVEGKHLNRFSKKIEKLESQLKQYANSATANATEARLKSQYSDFDQVVTKENIDALRASYPEVAETINSSTDLYSKAVSAYTLIKNLGIIPEDNYSKDREMAQNNASKPRPLTSVSPQQGDSPMSRANAFANGLTDELKDQLRKEMNEARKGI